MKAARLFNGDIMEFPDETSNEAIAKAAYDRTQAIKQKSQQETQARQVQTQQNQQRQQAEQQQVKQQQQVIREQDMALGAGKIQGMQALAGGMQQLTQVMAVMAQGLNTLGSLSEQIALLSQSVDTQTKVVAATGQSLISTLRTPKEFTKSNGTITGIQIKDEEIIH
jgi:hypothetical protein